MNWALILVSLAAVGVAQVNSLAISDCTGADCKENLLGELEKANIDLREAMKQFDNALTKQEEKIQQQKKVKSGSENNSSGFSLELYEKLIPCSTSPNSVNIIESVTQLKGIIFFTCHGLNYAPAYDGQTRQYLRNIDLPDSDFSSVSRYLVADPKEETLYLVVSPNFRSMDDYSEEAQKDYLWKINVNTREWQRVAIPDNFRVSLIGPTVDGKMMIGNESHILFYDNSGSIDKFLEYIQPVSGRATATKRIVQTKTGSIYIPGFLNIAQLDSNGIIDTLSDGQESSAGKQKIGFISDISEGPKGTIFVAEISVNRISILDQAFDRLLEVKGDTNKPYRLSFDVNHSRLVVLEWMDKSSAGAKIFYVVPEP